MRSELRDFDKEKNETKMPSLRENRKSRVSVWRQCLLKMQPGLWLLYGKDEEKVDTLYSKLYCSLGYKTMRLLSIQKVPAGRNEQMPRKEARSA